MAGGRSAAVAAWFAVLVLVVVGLSIAVMGEHRTRCAWAVTVGSNDRSAAEPGSESRSESSSEPGFVEVPCP